MEAGIEQYKTALKKAMAKITQLDTDLKKANQDDEIAVVGYACRFPGGANNPQKFWDLLSDGYSAVTEIREDRFDADDTFYSSVSEQGKSYTKYASFLDIDIKSFDNAHFEISEKEALSIDPQHRLMLEVSWEALENAGLSIDGLKGSKTGVFLGIDSIDYAKAEVFTNDSNNLTPYSLMGVSQHSAAGRLSYFYDFKGPSIVCNTACSSSLMALNAAVNALKSGQCDLAVVGGVNLLLLPDAFIGLSQFNALSPDGKCKTFDNSADGFGRGEGCGVVILKRLSDSLKDNNHVEALIKGVGVGQDGKSNGFYAPNGLSEQKVIRDALSAAGLKPDDIDYIEAHGTGTVLGDLIETQAISAVFKDKKDTLLIGSVKTNIGHLEAAAGMAGLIKVLLSLKNQCLPPSINFSTPNKNIDFTKIKVVGKLTPWEEKSGKRRAGLSSFGISGTLAHVIIEEYENEKTNALLNDIPYHLLTVSARSSSALREAMNLIKDDINDERNQPVDIAYSSNISKSRHEYRFAAVGEQRTGFMNVIDTCLANKEIFSYHTKYGQSDSHKIAFLFTGQGSIYENIAKQLYENSAVFKESLDGCEEIFSKLLNISILEAMFNGNASDLSRPIYSQPVIFSVEYSLTKVWDTLGIKPDMVIGHSIGEYTAACYAGLISFEDVARMIAWRSEIMESVDSGGKMLGVLTDYPTIMDAIEKSGCKNVSVAAVNAPKNVTISGLNEEVDAVIKVLHEKERVFVNNLGISHPFHSVLMNKYEDKYGEKIKDIKFLKHEINIISCDTGKIENEEHLANKKYWTKHLSKTVNFKAAIDTARSLGADVFIEIGGNATLSGLAGQCIHDKTALFLPSLRNGVNDYKQLLDSVRLLYLNGVTLDWEGFYRSYKTKKVILQGYPFQRKKLWKDLVTTTPKGFDRDLKEVEDRMMETGANVKKTKTIPSNIVEELKDLVHMVAGFDVDEISEVKELFAFGMDSLLLMTLGKQIMSKYAIEIPLDLFFTSLNTLEKIASYIAENRVLPELAATVEVLDEPKSLDDADSLRAADSNIDDNLVDFQQKARDRIIRGDHDIKSTSACEPDSSFNSNVFNLFDKQFHLLSEQMDIVRSLSGSIITPESLEYAPASFQSPELKPVVQLMAQSVAKQAAAEKQTEKRQNYYIPYKKFDTTDTSSDMKALQLAYIKEIENKYTSITKNSKSKTQSYRYVYASNRNSAGFRPVLKEMLYQIIAEKGKGSKLWDIDGNELIDITMGFGVNFFGHCPPFIERALLEEIKNGMPLGPMGRLAGEVARKISEMTGVERVFFCNSGTEANMFAVRIARAITKKNKIVCFKGSFHGTYDGFLGVPSYSESSKQSSLALAPGITDNAVKDLILLDYNDDSSLQYITAHANEIAAVIAEPVQSRRPDVQPKEFLKNLRTITSQNQIALIFDEIITGFRIGIGGAQEYFGVQADIITYGKVIGGGMPIGIVCGKSDYLDSIDGGMWQFGDSSVPPNNDRRTFVAGTFCHHPLAMAATNGVLDYIAENKTTLYTDMNEKTARFAGEMNAFFLEEQVPIRINHFSSQFRFTTTLDQEIFYYGLLAKGIYVWEGRNCFFSIAHTEADIAAVMQAVKQTALEMKKAGFFGDNQSPNSGFGLSAETELINADDDLLLEFPASIIQSRIYSQILSSEVDPFDISAAYFVTGAIDLNKLESIIKEIINRHEILRTSIYLENGELKQKLADQWEFKIKHFKQTENSDLNAFINSALIKFDLSVAPLIEVLLIDTFDNRKLMVFHFHHIAADGMSMDIFSKEFAMLYNGMYLPEMKKQYRDFVQWEKSYLESDTFKSDKAFWLDTLSDAPLATPLPYDFPKPEETLYPGDTVVKIIDKNLVSSLKKIAREKSSTLFMMLLSQVNILLHNISGMNDIAIATPVSSRYDGEFGDCIGMFTNTIVLPSNIQADMTFDEFIKNTKANCIGAYRHINYPFNQIISDLKIGSGNPYNIVFVYENTDTRKIDDDKLNLQTFNFAPAKQEFELCFELLEKDGEIRILLSYRTDLFKSETIRRFLDQLLLVIQQSSQNEIAYLSDIEIISESERAKVLYEFNNTKAEYNKEKSIAELFEEQVAQRTDNTAVVFENKRLTYAQLNKKANQLAYQLRTLGVKSDDRVAIIAERSLETIIGIYGIIKSGGAYVPIDLSYPKSRIEYILNDCAPKAVLTGTAGISFDTSVPVINLYDESVYEGSGEDLDLVNSPDDLAYIIYTSGTSGVPKGVMVEHKNVIRLVKSAKYIDLNEDSVFLQTGSLAFDASTLEIWGPGLNGGILHLESNEVFLDYQKLKEAIISKEVNTMWLTAALYNQLISMDSCMFDKLTHLLVGGEKLSEKHIAMLHDKNKTIRLTNGYGPTECTTFTTTYDIPADCKTLPIGRPITNTQIYILNGDKLCGIGIPGELCVAGDGVARGYLNHPELTAEKFVKNPFGEGNLYRSGDLARWMSDGNIEFLGRIDEQVKVRGFRIELGEIENAIKSIESIKDCAVIAREETSGDKAIYAYVVSEEEMGVPAIRDILGKTLPEYMIPAYMAQIEMIPVTRNGKLDRKALPEIEAKAEKEYVAPGTEIEEKICCIFGEILGIEKVGVKDNFFESGGHSLRATRLVNRIESETGVRITLKEVFKNQTVESLAELVTGKEAKTYTPIPKAEEKEYYAMSSVQKRIYLTQQMDLGSITYNMPGHIKIQGEIDPVHIRQVLQDMIDRHEIFRTEFIIINGEPVQKICNTVEADFEYFDDPVTPEEIIMDRFVKPFDLGKSPLIRMMLVKRQNYNLLLVDTHHIISDGMSMDIFTREISSLYNGRKLKELTHQYKDYSEWMRSRDISSQRDFWMQEFCDEVPVLDIPLDFVRPQKQSFKGSFVAKRIGKELSSRIKKLAKDTEATEFMVFLSAVMVLLSKYSRQNDIAVGSVMSSRTHKDTTEILGMFANTLVLRGQPEGHKTFTGFLGEMRDKCFKVYENQEYPFEELVENLAIQRDLSRNPLFDVMLGFQNNEKKDMDIKGASLQYSEYKSAIAKFDLSFDICWTTDLEYEIELEYCSDLFIQDTASRMLSHLISILSQLTDNPLIQLSKVAAITHVEKEKILGAFNRTQVTYPKQKTVAQLFEEQVVKQANKTAVVMEDQELSYKELNQKANVLALQLRDLGVKPNDCVAIMAKKSLEIIIGLCGIVKSGAAYVPIDMNYPKERIQFILNDCKPKALLVFGEEFETDIPCIDVTTACASAAKDCNPERINRQEDLAYIIYTSGTTGQPKGVMIEQKSIIKLVINCDYTPLDETVSILQVGQISFDASTFEIWGSLLNGGTLHLISDSTLLDYERFKSYLREKRITTIVVTTALFNQLIDYDEEIFDSLKHLLFGGEATSELHLQKLRDRQTDLDIRNLYGPTETTTIATHYVVRDLVKKTPIGKPISNTRTYIIEDQVLCGIGVPGELCITGDGLARGYLNNPQLTEEKFVPCPYEEGRMYRSGDLVRWLPDGNIEYLGRIDEQVKIRGYRIELREIEGAFRAIKGINDCIVLLKEIHGNKTLCAYFVAEEVIEIPALRMQLADLLPQYMLPAHIMQIDSVPVTRNGKIDKRKLPDIVVNSAFEFVAPSNEVECALCKAYEDVLGLDQVGINDNFFELGGDSLKAIQVVTNMRESGYTVTVQMIMQYQIVSAISAIAQKNNIAAKKNEETLFEGEVPFGMLQSLFSVSDIYSRNHFNMSLQFELSEPVSEHAMVQAVSAVIQHHDMLRAVVEEGIQIVRGSKDMFSFEMHDLRSCEDEETSQIKIRKTLQKVQQSLNIYSGPLFRVTVFQKEKGSLLHICVHHFVSDAVSLRILAEDLLAAYHCCKQQNPIRLPMKTSSYSEWSSRFRNPNYRHLLDVDKPYWETINARVKSVALSHDHNKRKRETRIHIGEKELSGIDILAKMIYKADMNQLLTAAIVQAICELRGVEEISLFLESYGRQETGVTEGLLLDRTVGWFTNIYPLVLQRHVDFEETLHHVIEEMRKVPNSGLGYLPAMETHQFTEMAIPDIAVNYLGNQGSFHDEAQGIKLSEEGYGQDIHPQNIFLSPLSINVTLSESVLISRFLYDQSVFTPKSVQILMDRMYALLGEHIRINQKAISNAVSWTSENRTTQYIKQAVQAMDMYTKTVISNNQFQEYPLTGIQKLSYEMGARNGIVAFPFNDRINQARFSQTWNKILQTFDVLRSSVIMGNSQERIRIYDWKAVQIPYLDISDLSYADRNECLKELSLKMDCFEQEKQYCLDELASKAVLVKLTETSFLVILACSHMIFDRFSSEVLRDRLSEFYYNDSGITELSYQNYYQLLRNEKVTVSEDTIIKRFEVEEYCDTMEAFVSKNENRIFKSFLYNSSNQEKWSQVPESKQLSISQKLFTIAMRYIFPHMDIPLLTLYIARQNSFINLFEYIGEFLDVVPVCLEEGKEISIEREVQPKLTFAKENNVYFSSLFSDETCETSQYSILQDRLSKLYEKRKYILVYNNTGVLNSANDLLVSSDKYTAFYNIMSIVVKPDGIFMNLPVDAAIENNIQTYLDEELVQLIEESLHE